MAKVAKEVKFKVGQKVRPRRLGVSPIEENYPALKGTPLLSITEVIKEGNRPKLRFSGTPGTYYAGDFAGVTVLTDKKKRHRAFKGTVMFDGLAPKKKKRKKK